MACHIGLEHLLKSGAWPSSVGPGHPWSNTP